MNVEEFEGKFGELQHDVRWDVFSDATILDYRRVIEGSNAKYWRRDGWMSGSDYKKYYGSDSDKIGVLLVNVEEDEWVLDIIMKDSEGNRYLYSISIALHDEARRKINGETYFQSPDVSVWAHLIKDDEMFDIEDSVLDITHLLPAFSSKTWQFINWTEDPFEEVKG